MKTEHEKLIADYLAGEHESEEALTQACKQNPAVAAELAHHIAIQRLATFSLQNKKDDDFINNFEEKFQSNVIKLASTKKIDIPTPNWQVLLAACAIVICTVLVFNNFIKSPSLGTVYKVAGAETPKGQIPSGYSVAKGNFTLIKGYAEIALNNGVTLILEAPSTLKIKSVNRVILSSGNLVARVPTGAIGFQVDTPSSQIVDLGTEFGVSVDSKGGSQVHVIDGEIKVRPSKKHKYEHLNENQARAFDLQHQVAVIKSEPQRFMRSLPGKSIDAPDYLHWRFDDAHENIFACSGKGINGKCFDASHKSLNKHTQKPSLVKGKFGQAVFFNGEDNWLETEFAGIGGNKPRTVAFWVNVPRDFQTHNGYGILSWGLPQKLSAWQISPNPSDEIGLLGRIRIGTGFGEIIGTTDLRDDAWHHIAIVLFGGDEADLSTHVLLYVDGKLEQSSRKSIAKVFTELNHPKSKPLQMGRNLAFSNPKNPKQTLRFFKGLLDEVYIFDSALEQDKISNLMRHNRL